MKVVIALIATVFISAGLVSALPLSGPGATASTIDWNANLTTAEGTLELSQPPYIAGDPRATGSQAAGTGGTNMLVVRPGQVSFPKSPENVSVVPEPTTMLLVGLGLAGAAYLRRKI